MKRLEVDDEGMIETATIATSFLSQPSYKHVIIGKLEENKIEAFGTVHLDTSQGSVIDMFLDYSKDIKNVLGYELKQAKKLCRALAQYFEILEKESKKD